MFTNKNAATKAEQSESLLNSSQVAIYDDHGNEIDPNVELSENSPKGETPRVVATIIKSFIGSGILFLPKAFSNGGWLFSLIIMVFMACVTEVTIMRLIACRKVVVGSYSHVGFIAYGRVAKIAVDICLVMSQAGFCCVYVVFIARNILQLLNVDKCWMSGDYLWVLILLQLPLLAPMTWIRKIKTFAYTNFIANAFVFGGLLGILLYCAVQWGETSTTVTVATFNKASFPLFLGTAVYAYEGIGMVVPIYDSLSKQGQRKFPWTLTFTLGGIASLYLLVGMIPYLYVEGVAHRELESAITLDLPAVWWAYMIIVAYCFALLFSFPLMLFPAVKIVESGVAPYLWGNQRGNQNGAYWKANIFRTVFVAVVLAISYVGASELDNLVSLVGCFCCTPLAFIFPSMFHYKLVGGSLFVRMSNIAIAVFGFGIFVFSTYQAIATWDITTIDPCPLAAAAGNVTLATL